MLRADGARQPKGQVLKTGEALEAPLHLENDKHEVIRGSLEFYRGRQINLKPTTLTVKLQPLYPDADPRACHLDDQEVRDDDDDDDDDDAATAAPASSFPPARSSRAATASDAALDKWGRGEEGVSQGASDSHGSGHDFVRAEDFDRMVELLPRQDADIEANFSMHAHTHATLYSLPNRSVLREMTARFPEVAAAMAIFARRQQHARIRLQWQDLGSSVVWLRNEEMRRLLFSISKVGMGFAMQYKKMDSVLASMRDARDRAALRERELNAQCRPGVGGQVERVAPDISDRHYILLRRYFDWWAEATEGLEALQDMLEMRSALAAYPAHLSNMQLQLQELDRHRRKKAAEDGALDESLRDLLEEENEIKMLDVRPEDVAAAKL